MEQPASRYAGPSYDDLDDTAGGVIRIGQFRYIIE